jgi:malto-oligosyltrehalose trehalohydrolase
MRHVHRMPFGTERRPDGSTRFRLWAPACERITLEVAADDFAQESGAAFREVPMKRIAGDWHECLVQALPPGARYRYRLPDGLAVPDPASRFNPDDIHAASAVTDPLAYVWRNGAWRGRPWHESVIYELHVGAFTPQGTFAAARERLAHLAGLGVTVVELMPVADFPGRRGWGYDGVLPFAPDAAYGTPDELKAFIDEAHGLGMSVLMDVVYNHFGPEGNYLHAYAPQFFDASRHTPWGAAINFDGPSSRVVRDFFVHNALYWVEEFRCDGLRLDAIHAIDDRSSPDIVTEIAAALRDGPGRERQVHLVLENDRNQARYLGRDEQARPRIASAQWNDDVHHVFHVLLTGQRDGYYSDYADESLERLGRSLAEGFVYQGQPSEFRDGEPRGEPSAQLPPQAFIDFLQTHDQVGNRAWGGRRPVADARRPGQPAARAGGADALHGRGVGGVDAVPLLLRLRARARRRGFEGPSRGVQPFRRIPGSPGARAYPGPQRDSHLRSVQARLGRARAHPASRTRGSGAPAAGDPQGPPRREVRRDAAGRRVRLRTRMADRAMDARRRFPAQPPDLVRARGRAGRRASRNRIGSRGAAPAAGAVPVRARGANRSAGWVRGDAGGGPRHPGGRR